MTPIRRLAVAAALLLPLAAGPALAQDYKPNTMPTPAKKVPKADKQAEIRKSTATALEKFYAADAKIKGQIDSAPGYAVFTTYGLSFLVGGAGGKGLVHDKATGKDTFMSMAQASAGVQIGAAESDMLLVFSNQKAMTDFVQKGWTVGVGGGGSAGAAGKSVGGSMTQQSGDTVVYTITKNGLQAGGAAAGTKFWRDKALN